jgi:predicted DNA-binding protein (MmcQ/YjbR family)
MDARKIKDWDEIRALVRESYRLIAPKKLAAQV